MSIPTQAEAYNFIHEFLSEITPFVENEFDIKIDLTPVITNKDLKYYGRAGYVNGRQTFRLNIGALLKYQVNAYREYKALDRFYGIGSFATEDWREWLKALILHEMSHVIQFSLPNQKTDLHISDRRFKRLGFFENGHGDFFRRIYKILRNEFLPGKEPLREDIKAFSGKEYKRKTFVQNHPMVGSEFETSLGKVVVLSYHTNRPKYPFVIRTETGKKYKVYEHFLQNSKNEG